MNKNLQTFLLGVFFLFFLFFNDHVCMYTFHRTMGFVVYTHSVKQYGHSTFLVITMTDR
jgi:hypothetical protein